MYSKFKSGGIGKFAYLVVGVNALAAVACVVKPFLQRRTSLLEIQRLGLDDVANEIAYAELQAIAPALLLSLVLSIGGVIAGFGLLRRREWAKRAWLYLSGLWLASAVVPVIFDPSAATIYPLAFRLAVFVVSLRVLLSATARNEFSTSLPPTA